MDRRQQKTRAAIFAAFRKLLSVKKFNTITVQDIIDEANIGRSTFYAHFETKDELLKAMCTDIFNHVFSDDLLSERTHDFSGHKNGLESRITHLLYHLKENSHDIVDILSCESGALFMMYFKQYLSEMFEKYIGHFKAEVPAEFLINHLVGSFSETVLWWINTDAMKHTPEEIAKYYITLVC